MIELKASRLNRLNSTSNAIVHLFATMPFLHFAKAGFSIFATMPFLHLAKTSFPSSQLCLFFISRRQVFHLRNYVFSSFCEIMFSSKTVLAIYNEPLPKTRIKGPKRQKGETRHERNFKLWFFDGRDLFFIMGSRSFFPAQKNF